MKMSNITIVISRIDTSNLKPLLLFKKLFHDDRIKGEAKEQIQRGRPYEI